MVETQGPVAEKLPTEAKDFDLEDGSPSSISNGDRISVAKPAQTAPHLIPAEKMSQLLLSEGPLAIRFITKALSSQIDGFKDLSASKQRRLIMSALEAGDRENAVIFAKIGWGQWSARKVDASEFEKEREVTNVANSKVKDLVSQERRRSSNNGANIKKVSSSLKRELGIQDRSMFLDENAVASEDEDEDSGPPGHEARNDFYDDHELNEHQTLPYDHIKRRKSSVVYADSTPDDPEQELISHAIRPMLKNYSHRRSSSKLRSPSISQRTSFRAANGSSEFLSETSRRRLSSTTDDHINRNMIDFQLGAQKHQEVLGKTSRGREPRASFSKESSIRSTLSSHPAHTTSAIPISNTVKTESAVYQGSADKLSSLSPQQKSHLDHSDTDEEDWERIGAESLRNSRAASLIRSPNMVAASNFQADQLPSHLSLSPPALEPRSNKEESPKRESPKRDPPADTQDAAFLLMSLKS